MVLNISKNSQNKCFWCMFQVERTDYPHWIRNTAIDTYLIHNKAIIIKAEKNNFLCFNQNIIN